MKAFTKFFLVATFTAASLAQAADIVAPPRTQEQIKSLARVGSSGGEKLDRTVHAVPPRTRDHQMSLVATGSSGGDKIVRTGLVGSPRDRVTFELAPLK